MFGWLQQQVALSKNGFDDLNVSIEEINESVASVQNSYEAWRETIKAFISESISSGNALGENVSDTIGKYQTLLLATSKYGNETKKEVSYMDLLKKAYDAHYGDMENSVSNAIQLREDERNGVYDGSTDVISALQAQWVAQDRWETKIEESQRSVDYLTSRLNAAKDTYDGYREKVDSTREAISDLSESYIDLARAADMAYKAQTRSRSGSSGGGSSGYYGSGSGTVSVGNVSASQSTANILHDLGIDGFAVGGTVDRTGLGIVHAGEVIKPAKVTTPYTSSMGGGVTINSVNITAPSGANASDFAYEFSRELQRQLRTF